MPFKGFTEARKSTWAGECLQKLFTASAEYFVISFVIKSIIKRQITSTSRFMKALSIIKSRTILLWFVSVRDADVNKALHLRAVLPE